jgi:hypothetical protein
MYCFTLAYSFVDRDRLFLRPTVRGRGVNGSIKKTRSSRHASCQRCATSTFMISRGLSLAWYYSPIPHRHSITHEPRPVELDPREPLQPLATLPRRTFKRNQLHSHTKVAVPAALDCEASHSCLSWRLHQRENV